MHVISHRSYHCLHKFGKPKEVAHSTGIDVASSSSFVSMIISWEDFDWLMKLKDTSLFLTTS